MTEILMMTLTIQLKKLQENRASRPSPIYEPDIDIQNLEDNLEQAEIKMKLEETENIKLQYIYDIQTTSSHINNIQESDNELAKKILIS